MRSQQTVKKKYLALQYTYNYLGPSNYNSSFSLQLNACFFNHFHTTTRCTWQKSRQITMHKSPTVDIVQTMYKKDYYSLKMYESMNKLKRFKGFMITITKKIIFSKYIEGKKLGQT